MKQGTIFGPLLCCGNTSQITKIGEDARTVISPHMSIAPLTYVDDIAAAGSSAIVKAVGKKLVKMEEEKKYTFNTDKTNYMVVKTGKKNEKEQELDMKVKRGKIERVKRYKILGNWMSESGKVNEQIAEIERRSWAMVNEVKSIAKEEMLGNLSTGAVLLVYERTMVPTMTYNLECWTRIEKKGVEELERLQGRVLKAILNLPSTAPYFGLLKEIGI